MWTAFQSFILRRNNNNNNNNNNNDNKDLVNSTCKLIDMTVPSDRNITLKETEKKCKYKDLELEIQRMWHMKTVVILSLIHI